MPKIDKIDLQNISLIKKEFKLKNISSIKIRKGNYEIELSSINIPTSVNLPTAIPDEKKSLLKKELDDNQKNENIIKSPMVGVAYLSADPTSPAFVKEGQHIQTR